MRNKIANILYAVISLILSLLLVWRIYETTYIFVAATIAMLFGFGISYYSAKKRFPGWLVVIIGFSGYLIGGLFAVSPRIFTGDVTNAIRSVFVAPLFSWKQLATLELPLGTFSNTLAPFFIVIYVVSLVSSWIYLTKPHRRYLLSLSSFMLIAFGIIFGLKSYSPDVVLLGIRFPRFTDTILGLVWIFTTAFWLNITRSNTSVKFIGTANRFSGTIGKVINAAVLLMLVIFSGVLAFSLTPILAGNSFSNLRSDPLTITPPALSPLDNYRSYFQTTKDNSNLDSKLLSVSGDVSENDYIRFATLPYYDGVKWVSSSSNPDDEFHQLVYRVNNERPTGNVTITNENYNSDWIPTLENVVGVNFNNNSLSQHIFYNAKNNSVFLSNAGVVEGKAQTDTSEIDLPQGVSYNLSYSINTPLPDDIAAIDSKPKYISAEKTPNLLKWISSVNKVAPGQTIGDVKKLADELTYYSYLSRSLDDPRGESIKSWLPSAGYSFVPSYSGQNIERIEAMFSDLMKSNTECSRQDKTSACGEVTGDEQQFAAAIALIADSKGFDTRVVVGAKLEQDNVIYGRDLRAWVEIKPSYSDTWTPIHFAVREDNKIPVVAPQPVPNAYTTDTHRQAAPIISEPDYKPQSGNASNKQGVQDIFSWAGILKTIKALFWWLFLILLIFLPFFAVFIAKRVRKHARASLHNAEASIAAGWRELVDFRSDCGSPYPPDSISRMDYARATNNNEIIELAQIADRAVYGDLEPLSNISIRFWSILQDVFDGAYKNMKPLEKLRCLFTVKSLVRRSK
jgi:hypothetical protein